MCLIVHKPLGATIPGDLIRSAWDDNPDGAGIMYRADDALKIYKVMPKDWADPAAHIEKVLSELADREVGVHFRWKTHGPVSRENVHPFPIPGRGGYVMHNGVISDKLLGPQYGTVRHIMSDTAFYVLTALQDAPGAEDPQFWNLVAGDVGTFNKMLVMDHAGKFLRVNDGQWSDYKGLRLSNLLSVPGYTEGQGWRKYYGTQSALTYDRSDADSTSAADSTGKDSAVVVYTHKDGKPQKVTRRERKILNAILRDGHWGKFDKLTGGNN